MAEDQNLTSLGGGDLTGNSGQLSDHKAGGSSGNGNATGVPPGDAIKKPKTEKQRERERERRRRRRRKKPQLRPGEDVPLILHSTAGQERGSGPSDAVLRETPGVAEELSAHAKEVSKIPDLAQTEDLVEPLPDLSIDQTKSELVAEEKVEAAAPEENLLEQAVPNEMSMVKQDELAQDEIVQPESEATDIPQAEDVSVAEEVPKPPEEMVPPSESKHLDASQQIFEESPTYEENNQEASAEQDLLAQPAEELPMLDEDAHADLLSEEDMLHVRRKEAQDLAKDLHQEEGSNLEEMPQKQWIVGSLLKTLGGIIALVVLVIGAFWIGSSLHLPDLFRDWFTPKPGEELVEGDNSQVVQDPELFRRWGFQTAAIVGRNLGDVRDLAYNVFFNANYFGKLKDPVFYGETGITAALYYGFGREAEYLRNKFIYYVKYLAQIRQANQVRVADVLDGKLRRDQALDDYIGELKAIFEQGNTLRKEINVQIDDLKVSINSLTPDKDRYEVDFFASLAETEAEKADMLIAKFIDVSQKQTDLKAKLAALSKLAEYYEEDLIAMKLRIEGLEQNRDALIEGVTVREVPGSGIDLIRE